MESVVGAKGSQMSSEGLEDGDTLMVGNTMGCRIQRRQWVQFCTC